MFTITYFYTLLITYTIDSSLHCKFLKLIAHTLSDYVGCDAMLTQCIGDILMGACVRQD